ncbi:hypothetical protein AB0L30_25190 [Microbispora rosea]|uniref:hypothetical protein n=1 Tax=Microbispora rosea TaxID=58117 RepID=UPI00344AA89C
MSRSVRLIGIGPDGETFTWDLPRSPRSSPALLVMFLYEHNDRNRAVVAVRLLAVLALVGSMLGVSSTAAHASTGQLRGVNWADARDNFVNGVLYVSGLGSSDTYSSAAATANQVVGQLHSITGANTSGYRSTSRPWRTTGRPTPGRSTPRSARAT